MSKQFLPCALLCILVHDLGIVKHQSRALVLRLMTDARGLECPKWSFKSLNTMTTDALAGIVVDEWDVCCTQCPPFHHPSAPEKDTTCMPKVSSHGFGIQQGLKDMRQF